MFGVWRLLAKAFVVERLRSDSEANRTPQSKRPKPKRRGRVESRPTFSRLSRDFISMARESEEPFQSDADGLNEFSILGYQETRRKFIKQVAGTSAAVAIGPSLLSSAPVDQADSTAAGASADSINVHLR